MLLVFFILTALHGLLRVEQNRPRSGWGLFALAVGLGILAKGPVMMLHAAFPALLAPSWSARARHHHWRWYGALGGALLLAAGIALVWALAAAPRGGPDYAQAILWHQTADRLVTGLALLAVQADVFHAVGRAYDVAPAARRIAALQARGVAVAHLGAYHGQYQFAGRLERPLEVLNRADLPKWLQAHPQGRVILYERIPTEGPGPEYVQPYRGRQLQLWSAAALREQNLGALD